MIEKRKRKRKMMIMAPEQETQPAVSVLAKPERTPGLPPSKPTNKNLILKAMSEAQESVTRTTNYSAVPHKQTHPCQVQSS
jgi:hypothetical protein